MGPHPSSNLHQGEPATEALDVDGDGRGPRRPGRLAPAGSRGPAHAGRARFKEQPVLNGLLVLACIALIVVAYTAVGPPSSSVDPATRTSTAKYGVVQSTVSGSGNVQSADQLNLGFKTSGTVTHIYVSQGEHVTEGQLLATLDPQSAEVTLEQAKASLQAAEANLAKEEEARRRNLLQVRPGRHRFGGIREHHAGHRNHRFDDATTAAPTTTTTTRGGTEASEQIVRQPERDIELREPSRQSTTPNDLHAPADTGTGSGSHHQTERRHARSEPRLRQGGRQERQAVRPERRAGGSEHASCTRPHSGTIVTLSGEVGETVSGTGTSKAASSSSSSSSTSSERRRRHGHQSATGASTGPPPPAPARAPPAPPRSRSSATSNRCSSSSR